MYSLVTEFRVLFWAILGVIIPFGLLLYFFPGDTDSYWAWVIHHPRSAILIGAGYVGAIAYYVFALRENDWRQTQNGMGGLITFCLFLLVATLLDWDRFRPYHFTTLVWLLFYYVGPFLVPIVYKVQTGRIEKHAAGKIEPPVNGVQISRGWQAWLVVRGFFYVTLAIFWLLSAETVSRAWPWMMEPLELRVFTGQIAIIGWNAIIAFRGERAWNAYRLGLLLGGAIGIMQIAGLFLSSSLYSWAVGVGYFIPIMFAEWVVTPAFMWALYERQRSLRLA